MNETQRRYEKVEEIMSNRAFIFICSYQTAWEQHMDESEKDGFSFKEIMNYISLF